jgi:hypothetical protein
MFRPSIPARDVSVSELERAVTRISAFGTLHHRGANGVLPVELLESRKSAPRKKPDSSCAKKCKAARGIRQWIKVSFVVGELGGDQGRTLRDRGMLRGDVLEPAVYIKVMFGFEQKGAQWIEDRLAGEELPDEGPLARRGTDGRTKYIKLSADEKKTAVQMYDQLIAAGWSARAALNHMKDSYDRYRNMAASSITAWRSTMAGQSNNSGKTDEAHKRKAGAPPSIPGEVRDKVNEKVCCAFLLDLMYHRIQVACSLLCWFAVNILHRSFLFTTSPCKFH